MKIKSSISLSILRFGLPIPSAVLIFNHLRLLLAQQETVIYIAASCRETIAYALMSVAILFAGAALFEYLDKKRKEA